MDRGTAEEPPTQEGLRQQPGGLGHLSILQGPRRVCVGGEAAPRLEQAGPCGESHVKGKAPWCPSCRLLPASPQPLSPNQPRAKPCAGPQRHKDGSGSRCPVGALCLGVGRSGKISCMRQCLRWV